MKNRILSSALTILILGLAGTAKVFAEDQPEPGVARISIMQGDVSTMRGDSGDWVAATVNAPVVAGDKVATAAHSRAEVQLDFANVLRMNETAEAKIADLTAKNIHVQVSTGLVDLVVFKGAEAGAEVDTPNMAVRPLTEGVYRIQVNSAEDTQLTVRQGEAEVSTPQGSTKVEKDQVIYVKGTDNPEYRVETAQAKDEWDRWNSDRDHQIEQAQAWQHTDHYYTGASDLDAHGHWVQVPGYDWCWTPYVDAGWVPYSDGRWTWEPYWGWTWVSYEPWGWAPYHYGRWFWGGFGWCWWPGVGFYGPRPIWAPAYVSFFGFGGRGWGVGIGFGGLGFGFGSIGWLPMGPRDPFNPWWGRGYGFHVTNITNITNVHGYVNPARGPLGSNLQAVMSNAHVRGALSTVSAENFANGHIAHNIQPASESMVHNGSMVHGTLPVAPTRASLSPSNRSVSRGALPSAAANNAHFFSRSSTSATHMPSFSSEASQMRSMVQHGPTAGAGQAGQLGQSGIRPGGQQTLGSRSNTENPATRTNSTFAGHTGTSAQAGTTRSSGGPNETAKNGWDRFASGNPANRATGGTGTPGSSAFAKNGTGPQASTSRLSGPATQGNQSGWQKFASHGEAPSGGHTGVSPSGSNQSHFSPSSGAGATGTRGQQGWERFSSHSQAPSGGGNGEGQFRSHFSGSRGGWDGAAPRSGGGYGSSRPPLELNRPILRERGSEGGSSGRGSGGGGHSSESSGGHGGSSSPHGEGGGGGGHSGGGGGGHGHR